MKPKENSNLGCWVVFLIYGCVILALASFPGIFDWSNTVKPWVLGMPFASFWQLLLSTLGIAGIGVFYLIESANKGMDLDIEAD